jgi:glycerol-3-phosphate O-acyltransferase
VAGDADLTDRATLAQTLRDLVESGLLTCYDGGPDTVWGVGDNQHLVAAVYRNSAVHVLLMRAIAELSLLAIIRTPNGDNRTGWRAALALRELLKFDFFFAGRAEFAEELWDEIAIMAGTGTQRRGRQGRCPGMAHQERPVGGASGATSVHRCLPGGRA